jgi:hypothetical protein
MSHPVYRTSHHFTARRRNAVSHCLAAAWGDGTKDPATVALREELWFGTLLPFFAVLLGIAASAAAGQIF